MAPPHIALVPWYVRRSLKNMCRGYCAFRRIRSGKIAKPVTAKETKSNSIGRLPQSDARKPARKGRSVMKSFPLSVVTSSFGHSEHIDNCFVDHLIDATRLENIRHDLQQSLLKVGAEYAEHNRCINNWKGQKELMARCSFIGLEHCLGSLDFNIKEAHALRDKTCAEETLLEDDLCKVQAALRQAMRAVEETARGYCSVPQRHRTLETLPMSKQFAYSLHVIVEMHRQLQKEDDAVKTISLEFLQCSKGSAKTELAKACMSARKALQVSREQYITRLHDFLSDEAAAALGNRIKTRSELLKCNLQHMPPRPTTWEWKCELPLQPDRDNEGRPTYFDAAQDLPLPVRNFYDLKWQKTIAETELKNTRLDYLRGLEQFLTAYPGSSQEEWDRMLRGAKLSDFHAAESVLVEQVNKADVPYQEARKQMRQFIDNEPQVSIASCSRCTSDYNACTNALDEAALPKLVHAKAGAFIPPGLVRQWQYLIAMMTIPGDPDDVAHSDVSSVVSLEPAIDLDTVSNSCGIDRDAESLAYKQKWLGRYRSIVDDGRRKLEDDIREFGDGRGDDCGMIGAYDCIRPAMLPRTSLLQQTFDTARHDRSDLCEAHQYTTPTDLTVTSALYLDSAIATADVG